MELTAGIVLFAVVAGFVGIAYGAYLILWILKLPEGSDKMKSISKAIQEGAKAYLNRQYTTVAYVAAALFIVLWGAGIWSDKFGLLTAVGFLIGAVASATAGYVGMVVAVRANVRTAQAAHSGLNAALQVAFQGGAVTGLLGRAEQLLACRAAGEVVELLQNRRQRDGDPEGGDREVEAGEPQRR